MQLMDLVHILGKDGSHHHAICITGNNEAYRDAVFSYIENVHGMERAGNPDLFLIETDSFSVDESRVLREKAALRAFSGEKRFFILVFTSATPEAQNALLKILEEPPTGAYFFILVPSVDILLPTVRSRLFLISGEVSADGKSSIDVRKFISATPGARLKMLEPLFKRASDDKTKPEALKEARQFLHGVVEALRNDLHTQKKVPHGLDEAMRAGSYLHDRSPSIKMLLEYLAVSI